MDTSKFTKERIVKFLSYYKPHKKIFIMDLFFAILSAVSVLIFPLLSGYLTQTVLSGWNEQSQKLCLAIGGLMLLTILIRVVSNVIYAYFGHAMAAKMEGTMREELFAHYEKLSFAFHSKASVGKLMTIISNDLMWMVEFFHHAPEDILMTLIKFIGAFFILININVPLTLIVFALFPILCWVAIRNDKIMEKALLKMRGDLSEVNGRAEDALSGIRTVKAFGNEKFELEKFRTRNQAYVKSHCYFYKVEALFYEVVDGYPQLLTMLVVFFGALMIGEGALDVPVLITFLLYISCLHEPVNIMMNFMKLYEEGKVSFFRFMNMMEIKPSVPEAEQPIERDTLSGEIKVEDVVFAYDAVEETVIEDLNFTIQSGESVAFVGSSGIGKTTVSSLIARFYDVTAGQIVIDGIDIKMLSTETLRRNIGIVQQEVVIFNGTVRDNILYGRPTATESEIEQAITLANAKEFIDRFPNGLDTVVGTKGITLSAGQRQRISIARVFLKNPPILILDEATSALDYESEMLVQRSIEKLMKNRTSIVIAHRLSTIKNVDRILVFKNKTVCEQGKHADLLAQNGEYANLCALGKI